MLFRWLLFNKIKSQYHLDMVYYFQKYHESYKKYNKHPIWKIRLDLGEWCFVNCIKSFKSFKLKNKISSKTSLLRLDKCFYYIINTLSFLIVLLSFINCESFVFISMFYDFVWIELFHIFYDSNGNYFTWIHQMKWKSLLISVMNIQFIK